MTIDINAWEIIGVGIWTLFTIWLTIWVKIFYDRRNTKKKEKKKLLNKLSVKRTKICLGYTSSKIEELVPQIPERFNSRNRKEVTVRRAYNKYFDAVSKGTESTQNLTTLFTSVLEAMGDAIGERKEYNQSARFSKITADKLNNKTFKVQAQKDKFEQKQQRKNQQVTVE